MTLFSKRIEELISESGETVASLAEIGGINRTTLQRIKSGEWPANLGVFQQSEPGFAAFAG